VGVRRYFARQILPLFAEQKPTEIHGFAQPARVALGKNTLFLPALLTPKTRGPQDPDLDASNHARASADQNPIRN
jgi:hypothetical protein